MIVSTEFLTNMTEKKNHLGNNKKDLVFTENKLYYQNI